MQELDESTEGWTQALRKKWILKTSLKAAKAYLSRANES